MSKFYHISPDGVIRKCSTTPDKCKYITQHSEDRSKLQEEVDKINSGMIKQEIRMKREIENAHTWMDYNLPYKRYVALKYNNMNLIKGDTSFNGFLANGYDKIDFYDKVVKLPEEFRIDIDRDPDRAREVFSKLSENEGFYDYLTHKSGNRVADEFARHPGVNFEFANKEFYGLNSLYSGTSLSYGDSCKFKDKVDTKGFSKTIKEYNSKLESDGRNLEISRMFSINDDESLVLVKAHHYIWKKDELSNGREYKEAEDFNFITTKDRLEYDILAFNK